MPKVLLVFPVSDVGGGENVLLNLARFRQRRDLEYSALVMSDVDGPLVDALRQLAIPHIRVRRGRMRNPVALFKTLRQIRSAVLELRPNVFLANSSQGYLYARWAAGGRLPGALYFMSVPDDRRSSLLDTLAWQTPPHRVFAASNTIRRALERRGVGAVSRVYHGTPEPAVTPDQRAAVAHNLEQLGIPSGAPVVLMPGRLQRWKGQLAFVEAFGRIAAACPQAHGILLGDALFGHEQAFRAEIDSEIGRRGLRNRVHLAGRDAIGPWLDRAACVVHASLSPDAFPNVCIEALAARRPLITNSECGVSEILVPGADAWVVPPRNVDALSEAIRDALTDSIKADRIATSGHHRYLEHCTPLHMVRPIERELCAIGRI